MTTDERTQTNIDTFIAPATEAGGITLVIGEHPALAVDLQDGPVGQVGMPEVHGYHAVLGQRPPFRVATGPRAHPPAL